MFVVQVSGKGSRMQPYFKAQKHNLYFQQELILERIVKNILTLREKPVIAIVDGIHLTDYVTQNSHVINRPGTRIESLLALIPNFLLEEEMVVLDCDTIHSPEDLALLSGNAILCESYVGTEKKFGFVRADDEGNLLSCNEKTQIEPLIAIGAYSFRVKDFQAATEKMPGTMSLLELYRVIPDVRVVKRKEPYYNLGDIDSYFASLKRLKKHDSNNRL